MNKNLAKVNVQRVSVQTMTVARVVGLTPVTPTNLRLLTNRVIRLERSLRATQLTVRRTVARVNVLEERMEVTQALATRAEQVALSTLDRVAALEAAIGPIDQSLAQLQQAVTSIDQAISALQQSVSSLETQIESGLTPNPQLQAQLTSLQGQPVTLTTPAGAVSGTVVLVGTDAVEIREANGDIVIVPYSKITTVS